MPAAVQLAAAHRQGDRAMAQVTVRYPAAAGEALAYRETHFFEQTAQGWTRVKPDPNLMGPWQTLETDDFTIRYRPLDLKAVIEAAPRLDLLYGKLRRDFGLPVAASTPNITLEVVTDELPNGYDLSFPTSTIAVPSPALLSVPVELTEDTVLYQSVVYPLAWKAGVSRWQPIIDVLKLWAPWADGGPLAAGREDLVRWLYQNAQAAPVAPHTAVPEGYARLCRTYRVWGLAPWQTSIPLACNESDTDQWSPWVNPRLGLRLSDVPPDIPMQSLAPSLLPNLASRVVTLATVIEYGVASYGRERLPHLMAALGEHDGWQTLLPAVFGVSAIEFEAGWQVYLKERYGQDTAP
jgi:hypothetical protein